MSAEFSVDEREELDEDEQDELDNQVLSRVENMIEGMKSAVQGIQTMIKHKKSGVSKVYKD